MSSILVIPISGISLVLSSALRYAAFLYPSISITAGQGEESIQRLGDRCHSNARIGSAVAISLERRGTILIGAPFFDPGGQPRGRVFGLESDTESFAAWNALFSNPVPEPPVEEYEWGEYELSASDGSFNDAFGSAVAIDGATSVIGSRFDDTDVGYDTGSAYIFQQTPKFASTLLFNFITSLNLRGGIERSLTVKVSNIEAAIELGDTNLALNLINAFIEDVAEKSGTQLTVNQAFTLTLWAIEIVSLLTFY